MNDQQTAEQATIAEKNRAAMELISVGERGVQYENFLMVIDRARYMAEATYSVPAFLKGNRSDCLAVVELAVNYGFQPGLVAQLCYMVNGVMRYMAQLEHAIINKSGLLQGRLDFAFEGEGDNRMCTCTGTFKDDPKPRTYTTPPLGQIQPKNSPLWKSDPDQQLTYLAVARWRRRWCPEVAAGFYSREEMIDAPYVGPDDAKDITEAATALHERLKAAANGGDGEVREGFHPAAVEDALAEKSIEAATTAQPTPARRKARGARKAKPKADTAKPKKRATGHGNANAAAPEPEKPPAPAKGGPTNAETYMTHLATWLSQCTTVEAIKDMWRAEKELRGRCNVAFEELTEAVDLRDERIKQVR